MSGYMRVFQIIEINNLGLLFSLVRFQASEACILRLSDELPFYPQEPQLKRVTISQSRRVNQLTDRYPKSYFLYRKQVGTYTNKASSCF